MRGVGKALFGGSRFVRWTVVPMVILCGLVLPLLEEHWTLERAWKLGLVECCLVLLVLAVGWPDRFRWAGRVLAGVLFTVNALALVSDLRDVPAGVSWTDTNAWNTARAMLILGLPSLWYAVRGRFGFGQTEEPRRAPKLGERLPVLPEKDTPHEPH